MTHSDAGNYKAKHSSDEKINESVGRAVEKKSIDGMITCADAEIIAGALKVTMRDVGLAVDLMEIRINKCQLGLFGYSPEKMIVRPADSVPDALEKSLREALVSGRLPCESAWNIAVQFGIPRMEVSAACETLKIKVKPCQLGAF